MMTTSLAHPVPVNPWPMIALFAYILVMATACYLDMAGHPEQMNCTLSVISMLLTAAILGFLARGAG